MGILGSRRLMDELELTTGVGGTTVIMRKRLAPNHVIGGREIAAIADEIHRHSVGSPLEELQSQNQELIRAMDEIRRRQAEIERLNDELKETNRGVLALNAELEDKADSLRMASETKSRFLSHVSHEFRTPLNSIRNLARILVSRMDGPLSAEQERQVLFIQSAADLLVEMVNDLLDLAKIEAGKSVLQPSEFTIAELFGAMRGMFRPLLANDNVALLFRDVTDLPPFVTDESKLSQILRNFISNALKYTDSGQVEVSAEVLAMIGSAFASPIPASGSRPSISRRSSTSSCRSRIRCRSGPRGPVWDCRCRCGWRSCSAARSSSTAGRVKGRRSRW